ncbi:hypothetical protein Tco_0752071 [Tanacetum coccineum]|uniref:Uncharacterized protein n=1 Tax=Tanacetum coccineum TaxID=301880 RepID=A0ABQ4Z5X9_9ASTR
MGGGWRWWCGGDEVGMVLMVRVAWLCCDEDDGLEMVGWCCCGDGGGDGRSVVGVASVYVVDGVDGVGGSELMATVRRW